MSQNMRNARAQRAAKSLPPHPATVVQAKPPHAAKSLPPHAATIVQARLPHAATVVQPKLQRAKAALRAQQTAPHPAASPRPAAPHSATLQKKARRMDARRPSRFAFGSVAQAMEQPSHGPVIALAKCQRRFGWLYAREGEFVGPNQPDMEVAYHFHNFIDKEGIGDLGLPGALCSLPKDAFEAGKVKHKEDQFGKKTKNKVRGTSNERREGLIVIACLDQQLQTATLHNDAAYGVWLQKTTYTDKSTGKHYIEAHYQWLWQLLMDEILVVHLEQLKPSGKKGDAHDGAQLDLCGLAPVPIASVSRLVIFYLNRCAERCGLKNVTEDELGALPLCQRIFDNYYEGFFASEDAKQCEMLRACFLLAQIVGNHHAAKALRDGIFDHYFNAG